MRFLYYGFKLHALVSFDGFITNIALTPAHVDDREALWELSPHNSDAIVLADKGYIGDSLAETLKNQGEMKLMALKRSNSKTPYPKSIRNWISKHRRRIETTFSQLVGQLNMDEVLAKSKSGLIARINTKLLMHNLAYFINKCLGKDFITRIGQIKHLMTTNSPPASASRVVLKPCALKSAPTSNAKSRPASKRRPRPK